MTPTLVTIEAAGRRRQVDLASYLDAGRAETASAAAYTWIKSLRNALVDGIPLRRRFTFREDSLWWFAELYLHKEQVVLEVFRTLAALEALVAAEQPTTISCRKGDRLTRALTRVFEATRHNRRLRRPTRIASYARLVAMEARATWLHVGALAARLKRRTPIPRRGTIVVAAFVHRAFWRTDKQDQEAEQYIGPVLSELAARLPDHAVRYVSLGPSTNFRARRWWHSVRRGAGVEDGHSIEAFATLADLRPSRKLWRQRHAIRRALWRSADLRAAARMHGCDCWPIIAHELAGVALLQWPWSARAMDEAGAALDVLTPSAALTYAEAGGWGRALMLECRRRRIPTAGLQHGFIYRHWLNYRHEPDEMGADPMHPADQGFPHPTTTLLFDGYARQHLLTAGCFPEHALRVTGSPRLDRLVQDVRDLSAADLARARSSAGAAPTDMLVLVATKYQEAKQALPHLLAAVATLSGVHVAIKTHPAETPAVYADLTRGLTHVTVLPAAMPLAPLLRASRALVTVNSTVALDAAVIGVPTLVIGLPNNLTPFVDAGALAGALSGSLAESLRQILYDEGFRGRLAEVQADVLSRFQMQSDGGATKRTVDEVLRLIAPAVER